MKKNLKQYLIFSLVISIALLSCSKSFAKFKIKERAIPNCTTTGEIGCPKGFRPSCPTQYKPACVFVTNKQMPACLANTNDTKAYHYFLDKINCIQDKSN